MDAEKRDPNWDELYSRADQAIRAVIESMPPPIKAEAEKLTTVLDKWPAEGLEADTMGIFHGFEANYASETPGPIFLFLGPLHEHCLEHQLDFEKEVRITYLHELGHHLGLDEDELDDRGLS
jgi:predicted Zn-dependent protease with MMP-like domain